MRISSIARSTSTIFALSAAALATPAALAVDLTVGSVQINQAVQYGTTQLVGNNTTTVRVTVNTNGGGAIASVDAVLRMSVNNVPVGGAPVFSLNGPITAPVSANLANINDTLNFTILAPVSGDVDFTVEVNPNRNVVETNYANNVFTVSNTVFNCRRVTEMPYVPVNYTANGAGLPPAELMEPGIGDGFIRSIYTTEWNYHKSPLPPLTWSQNINNSTSAFHNTLNDIRTNQLPAAGYPEAGFIYAYLPGNPFSGNGQAGGIPSNTAFGNTDTTRSQRTFAHEIGHCVGLNHNSNAINTVGFDEEHHLKDTQNLPQVFPTTKNDIMVAGLLTNQAWVNSNSYNTMLNDARLACVTSDGDEGVPPVPVLRVSGVITHDTRAVALDPVTRIRRGRLSIDNPNGDIGIQALNARGAVIWSLGFRTDTARELCSDPEHGHPPLSATGPFFSRIPETVAGESVNAVQIIERATGAVLATRTRSANAPHTIITAIQRVDMLNDARGGQRDAANAERLAERLTGRVRVTWASTDADGDALTHTVTYTPDNGGTWYPVVVNTTETSFEFDSTDIPASNANDGAFSVTTTDGLNVDVADEGGIAFGAGNPPETFLLTPNTGNTFQQHAPIAFHGTSWDPENQLLDGANMVWTSSLDGQIGTGRLFIKSNLSIGTHTIDLTGIDLDGMSMSKQVTITITPRTVISPDCNGNFVLDLVDIQNGTSQDLNGNGIPDECDTTPCPANIVTTGSSAGNVDIDDLLAVISAWGACPPQPAACPANIVTAGSSAIQVDIDDLLAVISAWGACP